MTLVGGGGGSGHGWDRVFCAVFQLGFVWVLAPSESKEEIESPLEIPLRPNQGNHGHERMVGVLAKSLRKILPAKSPQKKGLKIHPQ